MKALEIRINDQEPIIAATDNLTFVNLTYGYRSDRIVIMGNDILHYLTWYDAKPEKGDKILIKIIEVDEISPVILMKDCDRNEIKKRYEQLKLELQEQGLI